MTIEEIKQELTQIKQQNEEEKKKIAATLEELQQKKEEILKGMSENLTARNDKAYTAGSQDLNRINALIEFNTALLSEATTKPLINKEKNTAYYADIMKELKELKAQREAEIIKLIDKAKELINETNSDINTGNDVLKELQVNIYKDKSILNSKGIVIPPLVKKYNEYLSLYSYTK